MSDGQPTPEVDVVDSVLLVSEHDETIESLVNNQSDYEMACVASADQIVEHDAPIIILDASVEDNNVDRVVQRLIQIKRDDPTRVIILTGDKDAVSEVLKTNAHSLVYRAFYKPIHSNQVILSFKSAFSLHQELSAKRAQGEEVAIAALDPASNAAESALISKEQSKFKPVYGIAAGIVFVLIALVLMLSGGDDTDNELVSTEEIINFAPNNDDASISTDSATPNAKIIELINEGDKAALEGRFYSPAKDNAIYYYEKALSIDPYDTRAYESKKNVMALLRESFDQHIQSTEFDKALAIAKKLEQLDPLNVNNKKLEPRLQKAITAHVEKIKSSDNEEEIKKTASTLQNLGDEFAKSQTAVKALQKQTTLLNAIDESLSSKNLLPPAKNNAYSLISKALKENAVAADKLTPRRKQLSQALFSLASSKLAEDKLDETNKIIALIRQVGVDEQQLSALENEAAEKQKALDATSDNNGENGSQATEETAATDEDGVDEVAIIPPKLISRKPPEYPRKAYRLKTEGWIELSFTVNADGGITDIGVVSAKPEKTFDAAAIKALKQWKFSPAINQTTGKAVDYKVDSLKINFKMK